MLSAKIAHLADADAMLSGARPAHVYRALDQPLVQARRFGHLLGAIRIDQIQHVKVAIADVADERAGQRRRVQVTLGFDDAVGEARDGDARRRWSRPWRRD